MQEVMFGVLIAFSLSLIIPALFEKLKTKKQPQNKASFPVPADTPIANEDQQEANDKVLVGALSSAEQLSVCLNNEFYHIPASIAGSDYKDIKYIAIYQSRRFFGAAAGIRYYAKVKCARIMPRNAITEIPRQSHLPYVRFDTEKWQVLSVPILPKGKGITSARTTYKKLISAENMLQLLN